MNYVKLLLLVSIFSLGEYSFSQKDTLSEPDKVQSEKPDWYRFKGYVKYMQTIGFTDLNEIYVDNLIHNRLNYKFYISDNSTVSFELRNRVFYGATVNTNLQYGESITAYEGVLPFEFLWLSNGSDGIIRDSLGVVFSTNIDRFYYDYSSDKIQFRVGRQRINWGINTTWNPNDLFNSYNIYDFDYEERQGADAVRIKFFPSNMTSFDLAYKFTGDWNEDVFALKYLFNKKNYDVQFLVGKFKQKIAVGGGWAGSINMTGFKGEVTYFQASEFDTIGSLSASVTFDYSFNNGIYAMGTYLFNSTGANHPIDYNNQIFSVPNAEYLMPAKHNAMSQVSYQFTPIFTGALAVIYSFEINGLTVFPTLTFSLKENLDLDLIGQVFYQEVIDQGFQNIGNGVFWRIRRSF